MKSTNQCWRINQVNNNKWIIANEKVIESQMNQEVRC